MNFQFAKKYIKYKLTSKHKRGHGIHSPFVYELLRNVIEDRSKRDDYSKIEAIRKGLKHSNKEIEVNDLGAGSTVFKSNIRKVKDIAKYSLESKKYAQLLYRLSERFKPTTIIELGTSLGVTSLYLASGNKSSQLHTIEGCISTADIASESFNKLNASNITQIVGNFDNKLPELLADLETVDMVFFDGNHTKEATISYFNHCLDKINNNTVFIFDDIHWSEDMEQAWEYIKGNNTVKVTIDLFNIGLVFFKNELTKQDYIIRY